jgi:hypothetical protein
MGLPVVQNSKINKINFCGHNLNIRISPGVTGTWLCEMQLFKWSHRLMAWDCGLHVTDAGWGLARDIWTM